MSVGIDRDKRAARLAPAFSTTKRRGPRSLKGPERLPASLRHAPQVRLAECSLFGGRARSIVLELSSSGGAHVQLTKTLPRITLIVGSATHAQIVGFVGTSQGPGLDVIELQASTRRATSAVAGYVAALLSVAEEHLTNHRRRPAANALRVCEPRRRLRELGRAGG